MQNPKDLRRLDSPLVWTGTKPKRSHVQLSFSAPSSVCDRISPAATQPRSSFSSSLPLLLGLSASTPVFKFCSSTCFFFHPCRLAHHLTSKGPRQVSLFTLPGRRSLQKHQNKSCREARRINDLPVPLVPFTPSITQMVAGHLTQNKYVWRESRRWCILVY